MVKKLLPFIFKLIKAITIELVMILIEKYRNKKKKKPTESEK